MKFYHITHERNIGAIRSQGLQGYKGGSPLYLSTRKPLPKWISAVQADYYSTGRGGNLRIFEVNIPSSWTLKDESDVGPQYIYRGVTIPKGRVKLLPLLIPIKDAKGLEWDSSGRNVEWRSRTERNFGVTS